jgi:hypothetical protein
LVVVFHLVDGSSCPYVTEVPGVGKACCVSAPWVWPVNVNVKQLSPPQYVAVTLPVIVHWVLLLQTALLTTVRDPDVQARNVVR